MVQAPVAAQAVIRARSLVGQGRYIVRAGGRDATARTPDSVVRGRRGCDYAAHPRWPTRFLRYLRMDAA